MWSINYNYLNCYKNRTQDIKLLKPLIGRTGCSKYCTGCSVYWLCSSAIVLGNGWHFQSLRTVVRTMASVTL